MRDRLKSPIPQPVNTFALPVLLSAALLCSAPQSVYAQDQPPTPTPAEAAPQDTEAKGTLIITVKQADTEAPELRGKPVAGVVVRIDGPNIARSLNTRTDSFGIATFSGVPEGTYSVYFESTSFELVPKPKDINDAVAEVIVRNKETANVTLQAKQRIITVGVDYRVLRLRPNDVSNYVTRDRRFIQEFANTAGNNQDLTSVLRSVPGLVPDAVNQIHPRGENSLNAATYFDGILLPQQFAGRANSFILPGVIETVTTRVAGLMPEYGGGSGAIYDIKTIRPRTSQKPQIDGALRLGEFNTRGLTLNFSGGRPLRVKQKGQDRPALGNLSYLFAIDNRYTANALESPQSGGQTKFNDGASEMFFGKITANIGSERELGLLFNFSSGRTNIAQREGLDDGFAQFGGGYGFTGLRSEASGLASQVDLEQKLRQKDNNSLVGVTFSNRMPSGMQLKAALGYLKTTQSYVNVGTFNRNFVNLPSDNSIEYIPATKYDNDTFFVQADVTPLPLLKNVHNVKFGVVAHLFDGTDGYQYFPQSQTALNALARLDPRLVPIGQFVNNRYVVAGSPVAPAVIADRSGYYAALYAQDTFRPREGFVINLGVRLDSYQQDIKTQATVRGNNTDLEGINKTELSPRVNVSFMIPGTKIAFFRQPTIIRVGYNKLFTPPVWGQGNYINFRPGSTIPRNNGDIDVSPSEQVSPVQPQITETYDLSIERQLSLDKILKLTIYSKDFKNTLTAQQLIPGMQAGMLSVLNVGNGGASGVELSFDLLPRKDKDNKEIPSPYGYLVFNSSTSGPNSSNTFTNLGQPFGLEFYEWDQENTIDLGVGYKFQNGATAGLELYHGSGLFSSAKRFALSPIANSGREAVTLINLRYNTGPRFAKGKVGLELGIENLGDSKSLYSFRNGLAGTRFVQGRRIMLGAFGKF